MPLLWRSSRECRSERCKRAFLLAPICKVLLAPTLVSDRASPMKNLEVIFLLLELEFRCKNLFLIWEKHWEARI